MRGRTSLGSSVGISLVVHIGLYFALVHAAYAPPILELRMPTEVEFGVVDGDDDPEPAAEPPPPPPPVMPKPKPKPIEQPKDEGFGPVVDAGIEDEEVLPDASVPDAGFEQDLVADNEYGEGDTPGATGDGFGVGDGGHGMGKYAPPGAQIGLHVDLDVVRGSSLRLEEKALLGIIPEWRKLLRGSGLDPLRSKKMKRVFVATPDLKRAHLVVSVGFAGGTELVEGAVSKMARGKPAPWRTEDRHRVAPWHNRGPTERIVALVADDQFTITRPADLPRVLSVARAMGRRQAKEGIKGSQGSRGAKGLLGMFENEAVALSVEDTGRFVVGSPHGLPKSLRISVSPIDEFHASLTARGRYASPAEAGAAIEYLEEMKRRLVDHPRVELLGLRTGLESAKIKREENVATIDFYLTLHQTRYLVEMVSGALNPKKRDAGPTAMAEPDKR